MLDPCAGTIPLRLERLSSGLFQVHRQLLYRLEDPVALHARIHEYADQVLGRF